MIRCHHSSNSAFAAIVMTIVDIPAGGMGREMCISSQQGVRYHDLTTILTASQSQRDRSRSICH